MKLSRLIKSDDAAGTDGVSSLNAAPWARFYVTEIHDIHPGMERQFDILLDLLPEEANKKKTLLVVPNWQGRPNKAADQAFWKRLATMAGKTVLHGWTHSLGPSVWDWFFYGHDNRSEFARLNEQDARERLNAGLRSFIDVLGHVPDWFCSPRWLQSQVLGRVLKSAGFRGCMHYDCLHLFSGEAVPLPALCFDEGSRCLRQLPARLIRKRTIDTLLSSGRPFRLTLHPDDPDYPATWRQIQNLFAELEMAQWQALSLEDALKRWDGLFSQ